MSEMLDLAQSFVVDVDFGSDAEGFKVDTDLKADWCLEKIIENKAEILRLEMVVKEKVRILQERLQQFTEQKQKSVDYFEGLLQEYFKTLKLTPTKAGSKTYNLPSGKIQSKKQQPEYVVDNELLVKWLKDNKLNNYIKVEEKAQWGELKKVVNFDKGKVITEDGEVVPGVQVKDREDKFIVEV